MPRYLREADVIVAAAGVKHLIRAEDVKPGAAVLDVGVTRETHPETGKSLVFGDVAPASRMSPVTSRRTPAVWGR